MNDTVLVQIEHGVEYLYRVILHFVHGKFLDFLNDSGQITPCIVGDDDDFFWGFDDIFERDYVLVINFFEELVLLP